MTDPILVVRGLFSGYSEEDVLKGVDIEVERRALVAIIGPNGSGKSTLLKTIYGLTPARRGEIILIDQEKRSHRLNRMKPERITSLGVNMAPQLANVFPEMSVLENLEMGALPIRHRFAEQCDKVLAALPLLQPMLAKRAATLSGGQRQALAIARALMSDPSLLILDEPSAGLAPLVQDEVFATIQAINRLGVSILMVEQRARQCLAIAHFGYVLEQGRNRLAGAAHDLMNDPEVVRLYLGPRGISRADDRWARDEIEKNLRSARGRFLPFPDFAVLTTDPEDHDRRRQGDILISPARTQVSSTAKGHRRSGDDN